MNSTLSIDNQFMKKIIGSDYENFRVENREIQKNESTPKTPKYKISDLMKPTLKQSPRHLDFGVSPKIPKKILEGAAYGTPEQMLKHIQKNSVAISPLLCRRRL
jgi:hypothetical protein